MPADAERLKLDKRIHNQRAQLAWFESWNLEVDTWWRRRALEYRRQLIANGIKPAGDCKIIDMSETENQR